MHFRSEPLDSHRHEFSAFRCGEPSLDTWLRDSAADQQVRGHSRTWVWLEGEPARVVGYHTLSAHLVARDEVPSRLGRGGPVEIPAVLLGRLALDASLRGQGLGPVLVADALGRVVEAARTVGARLVVTHALSEKVAAGVYEPLGFRRIPDSLTLVQKVTDIAAAWDAS